MGSSLFQYTPSAKNKKNGENLLYLFADNSSRASACSGERRSRTNRLDEMREANRKPFPEIDQQSCAHESIIRNGIFRNVFVAMQVTPTSSYNA